mmetsp:Transcript_4893/g.7251  ORF Transcript_4893/g.7251 Transcript_4893/m.7251 type:complete len:276 (+) Transcript_4893:75-902(+)
MNAGARRIFKTAAVSASAAAAAGSASAEAREDFNFQPDKARVIFAPNSSEEKLSLSRKELSKIALWEVKDAPKDVLSGMIMTLGEDLAKDPAVQMAVYKRFGVSMGPAIKNVDETDVAEDQEIREMDRENLEQEVAYLKEELESQQTLNDQLIYHSDRLSEEKIKLKRDLSVQKMENAKLERERTLLKDKVKMMGGDYEEKELPKDELLPVLQEPNEEDEKKAETEWSMSQILIKALAVAAVVILMAVVKKKGAVTVAATAAAGAWTWMKTRMAK